MEVDYAKEGLNDGFRLPQPQRQGNVRLWRELQRLRSMLNALSPGRGSRSSSAMREADAGFSSSVYWEMTCHVQIPNTRRIGIIRERVNPSFS